MPLELGERAQMKLQGTEQDGRQGRPYFAGKNWGSWAIKNQGILILAKPPYVQLPILLRFSPVAQQGFSLTPEYVEIENYGLGEVDLAGYMIESHAAGTFPCPLPFPPQQYVFAPGSTLAAGQKTRVYSGTTASPVFQNPPISYFWVAQNIWLNPGDVADLYNPFNTLIDSLAYGTCAPP